MFGEVMEVCGAPARTLKASVTMEGIGLHTGRAVRLRVAPAPAGTGILFRRVDLLEGDGLATQAQRLADVTIKASPAAVTQTTLGTVLENAAGARVSTVEHLMAALAASGIDHAIVELDGPEVPILDGSAKPFLDAIERVGIRALPEARRALRVLTPFRVELGDAWAEIEPIEVGEAPQLTLCVTVDYDDAAIGRQSVRVEATSEAFRRDVAAARTFCRLGDVEAMRARGLALGGSLDNAVVVDGDTVLNEEGLRFEGEFVRHKALDLIGDLHLLCRPIIGRITAFKPGHGLNTRLAAAIGASPDVALVTMPAEDDEGVRVQA